eukprot:scaffold11683_cov63-Phaeocystis_antarctica.AAC.1
MTLGVQSHLFFIISDLVRRPLQRRMRPRLTLPRPAAATRTNAPRPCLALAPRLRSEYAQPLADRRALPAPATTNRSGAPSRTRSCHSSVAPSREAKSYVRGCWTALASARCPHSRSSSQAVRVRNAVGEGEHEG